MQRATSFFISLLINLASFAAFWSSVGISRISEFA